MNNMFLHNLTLLEEQLMTDDTRQSVGHRRSQNRTLLRPSAPPFQSTGQNVIESKRNKRQRVS